MELVRANLSALVPADPIFVPEHLFKTIPGNRTCGMQRLNTRFKVEIKEDFTEVEQNCLHLHS
jgi:hypothetical protein